MPGKMLTAAKTEELAAAAREASRRAYAPYSRFSVGAAILLEDGQIVSGCNVENASYSLTLCAERNAMSTVISRGGKKPVAIAIAGDGNKMCPPCGACRQFLIEFNPRMIVILEDKAGITTYVLEELLPANFRLEGKG